jgi:hypothetical protein
LAVLLVEVSQWLARVVPMRSRVRTTVHAPALVVPASRWDQALPWAEQQEE